MTKPPACAVCGQTPPTPLDVGGVPTCGRIRCGRTIQGGLNVPPVRVASGTGVQSLPPFRLVTFDYPDKGTGAPLNRVVFLIPSPDKSPHLIRGFDAGRAAYRCFHPDKVS
jgi:hypothetical protein